MTSIYKLLHPDTKEIRYIGKNVIKNIHACCNNKRKSAYGYKWIYKSIESKDKEL